MTLQNRVTPFGDIVANPARGRFTGYGPPERLAAADGLLTPASTPTVLRQGYAPDLHPSLSS